jgi:hypothetical protein
MWFYAQHTGKITANATTSPALPGYSGHGIRGINNPSQEQFADVGPVPRGLYAMRVRKPFEVPNSKLAAPVIVLTPVNHHAKGRTSLLIHGDSEAGNASKGCIILPPAARERLAAAIDARDNFLQVVW